MRQLPPGEHEDYLWDIWSQPAASFAAEHTRQKVPSTLFHMHKLTEVYDLLVFVIDRGIDGMWSLPARQHSHFCEYINISLNIYSVLNVNDIPKSQKTPDNWLNSLMLHQWREVWILSWLNLGVVLMLVICEQVCSFKGLIEIGLIGLNKYCTRTHSLTHSVWRGTGVGRACGRCPLWCPLACGQWWLVDWGPWYCVVWGEEDHRKAEQEYVL